MSHSRRKPTRTNYSKEGTIVRRIWNRKIRRQDKRAVAADQEPERHRGTSGWLTW